MALALAACQTPRLPALPVSVDPATGSEANIESLSAVIAREPSNPEAYNVRGSAYGRAGRYDEAIADFNKAIELDPNFARAYANRALVHRRNGDIEQALRRLQPRHPGRSRATPPPMSAAATSTASRASSTWRSPTTTRRSSSTAPIAQAFHNRGLVYQAQGQHQTAIEDFTTRDRLLAEVAGAL